MVATDGTFGDFRDFAFFRSVGNRICVDTWTVDDPKRVECIKLSVQFEFGKIKKIFRKFIFPILALV